MERKIRVNPETLLFKKYNLIKNIGGGSFGTVFLGINEWTNEKVAIKIEERKKGTSLEKEAYILYYLKGPGLPELKSFGKTKRYNILIETLLGKSLYDIFNDCNKQFTIKDRCMIGIQILERLEYIHSKNYIHRDIKPHNFLIGLKNEGLIYLIDFGLSKKYKSGRGKHVKFSISKHITGTPRFCSVNAMRGVEQSRRDDLESLSYMIIYFFKGFLPWQGLKLVSKYQRFDAIARMKKYIKIESLCENLPEEIVSFCKYTKKLKFAENPNYDYMKNLFVSLLNKNGYKNDHKFSWIKRGAQVGTEINYDTNMNNYNSHKNSPFKRLYQKIQMSLEKKRKELKEKERNQEYTLNTIYIDNKNIIQNQNDSNIRTINYIQSNDVNVLNNNNLYNLNIDNYKHSYNYPLVIYSNKLTENKEQNKFSIIAKSFKDEDDNNIVEENPINIPDKLSVIDAIKSNATNFQSSNNQILLISDKNNVLNKGIKIHDYIRQEEKEGGVIKNFDFKENEYFKINSPVFIENNNLKKISMNNSKKDSMKNSKNDEDIIKNNSNYNNKPNQKSEIEDTKNNSTKKEDLNINLNKNTKNKRIKLNNAINKNNNTEHKIHNAFFLYKDNLLETNNNNNKTMNGNIKDIQNIQKSEPFFIKHSIINLNNTNSKNIQPKLKEEFISKTDEKQNLIKSMKQNKPKNLFSLNKSKILLSQNQPKNLFSPNQFHNISPNNNNINYSEYVRQYQPKNLFPQNQFHNVNPNNNNNNNNNINNNYLNNTDIIINNINNNKNPNNIKQNELNHKYYIKINNYKKLNLNKPKLKTKNNNRNLKININDDYIDNKKIFSNSNKSNREFNNTNIIREIKLKNSGKRIIISPTQRQNGKRNEKLLNSNLYKNGNSYMYNIMNNNNNNNNTLSFSNKLKINQNNSNNFNQKLLNIKKNNNNKKIIINNLIIKNNCSNLVYNNNNKNRNSLNSPGLDNNSVFQKLKTNINNSRIYRPLSIRHNNSHNIYKNPFSSNNISSNDNVYNNKAIIP